EGLQGLLQAFQRWTIRGPDQIENHGQPGRAQRTHGLSYPPLVLVHIDHGHVHDPERPFPRAPIDGDLRPGLAEEPLVDAMRNDGRPSRHPPEHMRDRIAGVSREKKHSVRALKGPTLSDPEERELEAQPRQPVTLALPRLERQKVLAEGHDSTKAPGERAPGNEERIATARPGGARQRESLPQGPVQQASVESRRVRLDEPGSILDGPKRLL